MQIEKEQMSIEQDPMPIISEAANNHSQLAPTQMPNRTQILDETSNSSDSWTDDDGIFWSSNQPYEEFSPSSASDTDSD